MSEPKVSHQDLYQSISHSLTQTRGFDRPEPPLMIVDYPCGLGKTSVLLSVLEDQPDLLVLVVVQTLGEVERILSSVSEGRLYAPKEAGKTYRTKGEQLEPLVHAGKSIVMTHSLYERAGMLAQQGAFSRYQIIIDEVPNAVSVFDVELTSESFNEFYVGPGYCRVREDQLVVMTDKGGKDEERLKDALDEKLINGFKSRRLYYDGKRHFMQTIPTSLFTHANGVMVLTFLSEGSLFLKFLRSHEIEYEVLKSTACNRKFIQEAKCNLKIHAMMSLKNVSFAYSKQTSYLVKSQEVKSVRSTLKNLRQRGLANVDLSKVIITCAKSNWFHRSSGKINKAKSGLFSTDSRMFKGSNWLPNTTRGTNNYSNCSHAIYLYEQNANPILLNWLDANNAEFRSAYALTEVVQWLWRTRLRRGEPVDVYMPSKKMRELIQAWL